MLFLDGFFTFADRFNKAIHIAQAVLVLGAFIVGCALMANSSMPRSRSTTLILVYVCPAPLPICLPRLYSLC